MADYKFRNDFQKGMTMSPAHEDPTYLTFMLMFHFDDATIGFAGDNNIDCNGRLVAPDPSNEAIALSQSAELDVNPDASVGKLFAEIVNVECR